MINKKRQLTGSAQKPQKSTTFNDYFQEIDLHFKGRNHGEIPLEKLVEFILNPVTHEINPIVLNKFLKSLDNIKIRSKFILQIHIILTDYYNKSESELPLNSDLPLFVTESAQDSPKQKKQRVANVMERILFSYLETELVINSIELSDVELYLLMTYEEDFTQISRKNFLESYVSSKLSSNITLAKNLFKALFVRNNNMNFNDGIRLIIFNKLIDFLATAQNTIEVTNMNNKEIYTNSIEYNFFKLIFIEESNLKNADDPILTLVTNTYYQRLMNLVNGLQESNLVHNFTYHIITDIFLEVFSKDFYNMSYIFMIDQITNPLKKRIFDFVEKTLFVNILRGENLDLDKAYLKSIVNLLCHGYISRDIWLTFVKSMFNSVNDSPHIFKYILYVLHCIDIEITYEVRNRGLRDYLIEKLIESYIRVNTKGLPYFRDIILMFDINSDYCLLNNNKYSGLAIAKNVLIKLTTLFDNKEYKLIAREKDADLQFTLLTCILFNVHNTQEPYIGNHQLLFQLLSTVRGFYNPIYNTNNTRVYLTKNLTKLLFDLFTKQKNLPNQNNNIIKVEVEKQIFFLLSIYMNKLHPDSCMQTKLLLLPIITDHYLTIDVNYEVNIQISKIHDIIFHEKYYNNDCHNIPIDAYKNLNFLLNNDFTNIRFKGILPKIIIFLSGASSDMSNNNLIINQQYKNTIFKLQVIAIDYHINHFSYCINNRQLNDNQEQHIDFLKKLSNIVSGFPQDLNIYTSRISQSINNLIKTYLKTYHPENNDIILNEEFSNALQYFIINLLISNVYDLYKNPLSAEARKVFTNSLIKLLEGNYNNNELYTETQKLKVIYLLNQDFFEILYVLLLNSNTNLSLE